MRFFAVRHGKATWNEEGRILGRTPGELSVAGQKAAELIVPKIIELSPDITYCSTLTRTKQTIAPTLLAKPINIEYTDALIERNFGSLEGQRFDEVDWDGFWNLPEDSTEYGAESLADFNKRIANFIIYVSKKSQNITLAVTHIGVMNRLGFLQDPKSHGFINYPNTELTEFNFDKMLYTAKQIIS